MAYDEKTTARFRSALGARDGLTEKRMMGGMCFMLNGNMIGGADRTKDGVARLMFRVGKDNDAVASARTGAQPMIQGGRRMTGFFFLNEAGCSDETLQEWMDLALSFVTSLPPKKPK